MPVTDHAPAPPGPGARQRDVAAYLIELYGAGDDCRGKLAAVKQVLAAPSPP